MLRGAPYKRAIRRKYVIRGVFYFIGIFNFGRETHITGGFILYGAFPGID